MADSTQYRRNRRRRPLPSTFRSLGPPACAHASHRRRYHGAQAQALNRRIRSFFVLLVIGLVVGLRLLAAHEDTSMVPRRLRGRAPTQSSSQSDRPRAVTSVVLPHEAGVVKSVGAFVRQYERTARRTGNPGTYRFKRQIERGRRACRDARSADSSRPSRSCERMSSETHRGRRGCSSADVDKALCGLRRHRPAAEAGGSTSRMAAPQRVPGVEATPDGCHRTRSKGDYRRDWMRSGYPLRTARRSPRRRSSRRDGEQPEITARSPRRRESPRR